MTAPSILVADDDDDIRDLIAHKLRKAGYAVRAVSNGADALSSARRNPPDLVILDVAMPGMDGYDVCYWLHAARDTATIPVLMVSAFVAQDDVGNAYAAGADDYLAKPFHNNELLRRIGFLLNA